MTVIPSAARDLSCGFKGPSAFGFGMTAFAAGSLRPASGFTSAIAAAEAVARKHGAAHPEVLPTSSETGFGIAELRAEIAAVGLG